MKWLVAIFKRTKLKVGDEVISSKNVYGLGLVCRITRIYDRCSSGERIKYCKVEFTRNGIKKEINVSYRSCKKVEQ